MQPSSTDDATALRPPDAKPVASRQLTPGTVLGGRYRIVSLVGRGGMGEVYRADDLKLGQTVALKFLSHGNAARLFEEVRIGRQISHPNVCRLYDIAEVDGQLFITMEFIDGEDLASLLRRIGRLPSEKALTLMREICAGLASAHDKGVIHRDLKPANVMIDGRGRGRVTDFGLAVADGHVHDGAGTPAYMAPEQLAGERASAKSDIYALGLVLYEIFTGKRAFEAATTAELLERQRRGDFPRPSMVTRDVPPAVERIITRCLDADAAARPASVEEILREMPGGDPLAAAVAAGETPSPAMVAAAARVGDLPIPAAWLLLVIAIAGLGASAILAERTLLYRQTEVKSPDVLQERARVLLREAAMTGAPRDWDSFVTRDGDQLMTTYRQSTTPMHPQNADARLFADDPPLAPGMASVVLDGSGGLLAMTIVPPALEAPRAYDPPRWEPFISAAGFDAARLASAVPEWAAPVDSDAKSAWKTPSGSHIEAAAYHGRPVWFAVLPPAAYRTAARPPERTVADRLAYAMFVAFMIALPAVALLLARRNLRRRQGDRTGALRIGALFLGLMFVGLSARAHHPMDFTDEWMIASWHTAQATFWGLITGVMYLALEPFVRRRWPEMLISWTRMLSGRITDPMIGRDLLLGASGAAVMNLVWHATLVVSQVRNLGPTYTLGPGRQMIFAIAFTAAEAVLRGVGLVVLLVILRAIVRNDVLASVLTTLLISVSILGDTAGPFTLRAAYAVSATVLGVMLARQFGLLAVMAYAFFGLLPRRIPLTLDPNAWYFARSSIVLVLLIGLMLFAFRTAVGSRRWFPQLAFD